MSINSIGNYTIQKGDCLWNIAKNHYKKDGENATNAEIAKIVDKMVELNDIKNPDLIFANDELKMPEYDGFDVQIEDEELDEEDDKKDGKKADEDGEKDSAVKDFINADVSKIKIKSTDETEPKDGAKTEGETPKEETQSGVTPASEDGQDGQTPVAQEEQGKENKFEAFANWSASIAINAASAGETAGSKISDTGLDNEEYNKQYDEAYGKAYNEVVANDTGFSILSEGQTIPEGKATLEPYTEIAKAQIETYNTSEDNETVDLKEYIMGELTQYSKHYEEIDLEDIEKEADKFIEQYKEDPAKIEENNMTEMFKKVANVHNFFDFNGDGVLEQDEIAEYYHILDVSDNEEGKQDGKIEFNSFAHWDGITSTESDERTNIKADFVNQYKTAHPEKFSETI